MKERKETINMAIANVLSIVFLVVTSIVLFGIYELVWGFDKDVFIQIYENGSGDIIFFLSLFAGVVVHEAIHGLVWGYFAKSKYKSISFGFMWKYFAPYCHCSEPLKVKYYATGALMPLFVLGIVPAIVGLAIDNIFVLFFAVIFITAAIGDIMVAWKLRKEKAQNLVLDHPSEAGYLVYEED